MNDEKTRPDSKVLNAVIVANNLAKGVYHKPKEEKEEPAGKREKALQLQRFCSCKAKNIRFAMSFRVPQCVMS